MRTAMTLYKALLMGLTVTLVLSGCNKDKTTGDAEVVASTPTPVETTTELDPVVTDSIDNVLSISRITPSGVDVPASGQQIVFKFSKPVVPVGEMRRDAKDLPITIEPAVNCQWLWLDTSSLSCQLDQSDSLALSTEYVINVKQGMAIGEGTGMKGDLSHRFTTQRPTINQTYLQEWRDLGKPVIQVSFNQPVTKQSIIDSLSFLGDDREVGVSITSDWNPLTSAHYFRGKNETEYTLIPATDISNQPEEEIEKIRDRLAKKAKGGSEARNNWTLSPANDLPENTEVTINLSAGLTSIYGVEPGVGDGHVHSFQTLPEFEFLGVSCSTPESYDRLEIFPEDASEDTLWDEQCNPLDNVAFIFSSPVSFNELKTQFSMTPALNGGREDYDPWSNRDDTYRLSRYLESRYENYSDEQPPYYVYLPEYLKAFQRYDIKNLPDFKDEFGRSLIEPVDMMFATAHRDPNLVLNHSHAVLEKNVDSDAAVVITNLDKLSASYDQLTTEALRQDRFYTKDLNAAEDISYPVPLGARDVLGDQSGVMSGFINSDPVISHYYPESYRFFAQVTPYQVHVKLGHFNSMAWVTEMATGLPVADAVVNLYPDHYYHLNEQPENFSRAVTGADGIALLPGIVDIDPDLQFSSYYGHEEDRFFVRVEKGEDMALLPLDYTYRSSSNGAWPNLQSINQYMHAWGTTAQGIYKVGDTIQYKMYVRNQSNKHWVEPGLDNYSLQIIDPKGQVVEEIQSLSLSEFGAYAGEFTVSKNAAVGWYSFELRYNTEDITFRPMRVLVSDFTPAPFRVSSELKGDQFQPGDNIEITTAAKMHAGGPYADADTRVTVNVSPSTFSSKKPKAKGFSFYPAPPEEEDGERGYQGNNRAYQGSEQGDKQGELITSFELEDYEIYYGRIRVESAVRDDRGKYVASSTSASYLGRDRFVGLRDNSWVHEANELAGIDVIVTDTQGALVAGTDVVVAVEREVTKAARVKGAGNAYLTEYTTEWESVSTCELVSEVDPITCEYTPLEPGSYRLTASITDTKDRIATSQSHTWVTGSGEYVWYQPDDNSLQIIPDEESYKIGDTAKFLVKNPYPGAEALITVERYGVLRHWRQTLEGSTPIIEVPIDGDDFPGVYLSVIVTSPRVAQPLGEGNVDLGKPAFKMGYIKVPVKDIQKEIDVVIDTDAEVYKPRDTVKAQVSAASRSGNNEAMEVAVVVIDEAVFDLNSSGKNYYDPYYGFNHLESLGVENYNLLMRLVGRQAFPKKGANAGGDGGGEDGAGLRNIMKFVSYWNPSIKLDANGQADFEFELPDNLTGWRIFAMAVTPTDQMGLGDVNFKVNQPVELRPVMPNQLTEGDVFQAGFSVMNRTDKEQTMNVLIRAAGDALEETVEKTFKVTLPAYERKKLFLPVTTKKSGELAFLATADNGTDKDAIEHHVPVNKRRSLITAATYGSTTDASVSELIKFPDDIYEDVGGLSVVVAPSVVGNIEGAFNYIRDYPYYCWEQRLTKGVAASQYQQLKDYMPDDFKWEGSQGLPQQTLNDAAGFQAPNGGMTYWINNNSYVSPYLSAYTALSFNWLRSQGHDVPEQVETKLHQYLQNLLRQDNFPNDNNQGLHSSVRAVALAALAKHKSVTKQDLDRYKTHVPKMDLFGKAHYLQAAIDVEAKQEDIDEVTNTILSHSVQSGGKFQFNETLQFNQQAMLHTPLRSNCAILSSLLKVSELNAAGEALVGDVPFKQVRAITQTRGNRDHWENTQENIFCMNALVEYSNVYESEKPAMKVISVFNADNATEPQVIGETSFAALSDEPVTLQNEELPIVSGLSGNVAINKEGPGRVYYGLRMQYATKADNAERINAGIEIRREYSVQRDDEWKIIQSPLQLEQGELVRIDIFADVSTARHFVVIDDPVPGGLEPVNRDLATSSQIDANEAKYKASESSWWYSRKDWVNYGRYGYSFYHQELRHDSARFYSDYLPAGNYHLSYTAQAIASGEFSVMPVKAEEMYDPDVYGLGLPSTLEVE